VWLGLPGGEGQGFVKLPNGGSAVEEGKEACVGWEHVRVVGEGHFDGDSVGHQLQIIVGEFAPVLRRDGVAPEEAVGGGTAQSAGEGVGPDSEVWGAFDNEIE